MPGTQFYLEKGYSPTFRHVTTAGAGSVALWTPTTSCRIVLTELTISSNLGGSVVISMGNTGGSKIFQFLLGGSVTISPVITAIETTAYDRPLHVAVSGGGTEGFAVTAMGFEIPAF